MTDPITNRDLGDGQPETDSLALHLLTSEDAKPFRDAVASAVGARMDDLIIGGGGTCALINQMVGGVR